MNFILLRNAMLTYIRKVVTAAGVQATYGLTKRERVRENESRNTKINKKKSYENIFYNLRKTLLVK